jgi:hypothetical protein
MVISITLAELEDMYNELNSEIHSLSLIEYMNKCSYNKFPCFHLKTFSNLDF